MDIKIIKELYAMTAYAKRGDEIGMMTCGGVCNVDDEMDFYKLSLSVYNKCHEKFPLVDGWREHDLQCEKLSDDFIKSAIQLA